MLNIHKTSACSHRSLNWPNFFLSLEANKTKKKKNQSETAKLPVIKTFLCQKILLDCYKELTLEILAKISLQKPLSYR